MIIQYGPYPPPYGGISIYIKRFKNKLDEKNYKNRLLTTNKIAKKNENILYIRFKFLPFFFLFKHNIKIVHYNITGVRSKLKIGFLNKYLTSSKIKKVLTIHGDTSRLFGKSTDKKLIKFLNTFSAIICVRKDDDKILRNKGVKSKISVIPAFIPPTPDETDIKQLPGIFNQIRKTHKFLITANAFKISFFNNEDLYGIDLSIELMKKLVKNGYKDIGFIYVIPDIGDYDYYQKMQNLIKQYNLEDYFHFYTESVAYPAVINMCDLFIRPTNTDGDALSIREAISLKKPAIASDVCKRPEGTILFENRNIDDLYSKTIQVIDNYDEEKKKIENIEFEDNAEKILELYRKVLNEK